MEYSEKTRHYHPDGNVFTDEEMEQSKKQSEDFYKSLTKDKKKEETWEECSLRKTAEINNAYNKYEKEVLT